MSELIYLKHWQIDFDKWDKTILSSKTPLVFAESFYLNATSGNWGALVTKNYATVMPITFKKKYTQTYLSQPPFTSQLGIFGENNYDIETQFLSFIISKYNFIEIELNHLNTTESKFKSDKKTFVIADFLLFNYNDNTKRNIKKALANNYVIKHVDEKDVMNLSEKFVNHFLKSELSVKQKHINIFNSLLLSALNEKKLTSFIACDINGNIKAIAHFICNNFHALYLKGCVINKAENNGSMHFLLDYAINYFKDKSCVFDFGGGANSTTLANFYKGFGAQPQNYSQFKVNNLPFIFKFLKK
jgi:hypothetical protein